MAALISGPQTACYDPVRGRVVIPEILPVPPPSETPDTEARVEAGPGKPLTNLPLAAACMVAAALLFALMSVMVKLLSRELPNAVVVFLRSSLSLLLFLPLLRHGASHLRTQHLKEHLLRGAVGMGAMYCFFFTIAELGLAEALLLNYSLPLFIPLAERAWLGEPTPRGIWKPLALGMLGLVCILKPGMSLFQPVAMVGILGAMLAATAQVGVRRLTLTESVTKIVFYFAICSTFIALGPALLVWTTPNASRIPIVLGLVASGTVGQFLMTRAYQLAPAAQVGPFIYGSVVFAALLDWAIFSRHPDALSSLGTLLVVVAGVIALRRHRRARPERAKSERINQETL
jgi:drug/metabolite transporter (DMT)-like permease